MSEYDNGFAAAQREYDNRSDVSFFGDDNDKDPDINVNEILDEYDSYKIMEYIERLMNKY